MYDNCFQASVGMSPCETLYDWSCKSLLCWVEASKSSFVGPELVQSSLESVSAIRRRIIYLNDERILNVRWNILAAQSRQKKYANIHRTDLEFQVRDFVFLRVAARKGLQRVPRLGKLASRYVGPFRVTTQIGPIP